MAAGVGTSDIEVLSVTEVLSATTLRHRRVSRAPLGPLGSSSSHQRRILELVLQNDHASFRITPSHPMQRIAAEPARALPLAGLLAAAASVLACVPALKGSQPHVPHQREKEVPC